jgi:F-type H+-transporting ATPase subunit gamma
MPSLREMRLRIRSVRNIAQVTKALEAVSASKVRRAQQAAVSARPYAGKAWQVVQDLANQPGGESLHPLLVSRAQINHVLVLMISGDRGLAGAYNVNIVRETLGLFRASPVPVRYVVVGRKGREMLIRRGADLLAEFSHLPTVPSFADVSAIGRLAVNEFLSERADEVYLAYTEFISFIHQHPRIRRLLPMHVPEAEKHPRGEAPPSGPQPVYLYEPGRAELLDRIIPRFTMLQVYQAILESLASEHAARMVTMSHATENALELVGNLQLDYNKARQESITSDLLDIAGGAEAFSASARTAVQSHVV